jgi:hypothetical protein
MLVPKPHLGSSSPHLVAAAAVLAAVLLLTTVAHASTECSGDIPVGSTDDYDDWGVSLDIAPDGTAWAAWMGVDPENLDEEIYFSRYTSGGWSERQRLHGENSVDDRFPVLSVGDDGVVWVVWYKWSSSGARLYVSHGGAGGWSAPEPVHPGAGRYDDKTIFAIDSTNVWMATATYVSESGDDMIVAYHWQGTEWEGPWHIGVPGTNSDYPDFGVDWEGRPWVVWFAKNPATAMGPIMASTWTGTEWTEYQTVSDDSLNGSHPEIVFDGDVPMVTWTGSYDTTVDIKYSRYEVGSWTPSGPVSLPDSEGDWDYNRSLARNSEGLISAVWEGGNHYQTYSAAIYMSSWDGGGWTPEKKVNDDGPYTIDRYPSGALDDDGGLWVAWQSYSEAGPPLATDIYSSVCVQTTPVSFGPAQAEVHDGAVAIGWLASGEAADGPFDIWRYSEPAGGDAPLMLPPPDAVVLNEAPLSGPPYEWIDQSPEPGLVNSYWVSWDAPGGVRYAGPSSVLVDGGPADVLPARVLFVRPNPTRSGGCFHLKQSDAGHVEVALYTVGGRAVRTFESVSGSALGAESDLCWDGLDDSGERVASGAYMWELRFNGSSVPGQKGLVTVLR